MYSYPDLDGRSSSSAKPVSVRTEAQTVDGISVIQSIQVLVVIKIPEHGLGILATGGAQRAVRRHSHRIQVPAVAVVVSFELTVGQAPDLTEKYEKKHKIH